jgi:glycosyltransferase involved in cell wall biosynthesis
MNQLYTYRPRISTVSHGVSRPVWSVMIPTYNCAKYLRQTLASVLAQDPGPEVMQIEVIDDCSTKDDPQAVVEELGHGRVGFYRQPENMGYIRNFETCLQRSRGNLIHLLHGDDCVKDGFYRKLQSAFEENPSIGAAFCRQIYIDEHDNFLKITDLEQSESGILNGWLEEIATECRIQTPSIVVRRDVYEKLGGFDYRLSCCGEDWLMWVQIAANYPVWYEIEPLAQYRIRSSSLSGNSIRTGKYMQDLRKTINIFKQYLPAKNANKITRKAREIWAFHAIRYIAPQFLAEGDISAAIIQVQEALKCSVSLQVIKELTPLVCKISKQQIKRTITINLISKNIVI